MLCEAHAEPLLTCGLLTRVQRHPVAIALASDKDRLAKSTRIVTSFDTIEFDSITHFYTGT